MNSVSKVNGTPKLNRKEYYKYNVTKELIYKYLVEKSYCEITKEISGRHEIIC